MCDATMFSGLLQQIVEIEAALLFRRRRIGRRVRGRCVLRLLQKAIEPAEKICAGCIRCSGIRPGRGLVRAGLPEVSNPTKNFPRVASHQAPRRSKEDAPDRNLINLIDRLAHRAGDLDETRQRHVTALVRARRREVRLLRDVAAEAQLQRHLVQRGIRRHRLQRDGSVHIGLKRRALEHGAAQVHGPVGDFNLRIHP